MKICTVLGTRPEIIRLSHVIPLLDGLSDHTLVHTGQNYDERLDRIFFDELNVREPDVRLTASGIGQIIEGAEAVFRERKPDRVLILGDTDSGLSALAARRLGIPVYHMEAGNRCFDDRVPEEINRRVIDHASSVLLPYTERSRANLLREGIASDRIFVTGNPIRQVMNKYRDLIRRKEKRSALGQVPPYFLATLHRAETVDVPEKLRAVLQGLSLVGVGHGLPVILPLHPRTRDRGNGKAYLNVNFVDPLGFPEFVALEKSAVCILTDSGTVQEEACILGVPSVTLRDATERPETIECGSGILAGTDPDAICAAVDVALSLPRTWIPPPEYTRTDVAETVVRIVTGR